MSKRQPARRLDTIKSFVTIIDVILQKIELPRHYIAKKHEDFNDSEIVSRFLIATFNPL